MLTRALPLNVHRCLSFLSVSGHRLPSLNCYACILAWLYGNVKGYLGDLGDLGDFSTSFKVDAERNPSPKDCP
jgi:hypothetical protein